MSFLTLDDLELYYHGTGSGDPVVLIHGLASDHTVWDGLIPFFKENYRVLVVDLRGHGKSGATPGPYSIELFAQDIAQLLESLNIDQAHFIGHSMGGCVLQVLALNYPEKIRSLTLISSFAHVNSHLKNVLSKLLKILSEEGFCGFFDCALKYTYTPRFLEKNREFFDEIRNTMSETVSLPVLNASINACLNVNFQGSLKSIGAPTLVIQGKEDLFTPPILGKQIQKGIPNSQIEIMDSVGHNLLVEQPDETYTSFKHFLKGNNF